MTPTADSAAAPADVHVTLTDRADQPPVIADDPTPGAAGPVPTARLAHVPITFFAAVMGLAGLTLAWQRAEIVLGAPAWVTWLLVSLTTVAFVAAAAGYLGKTFRYAEQVRVDLTHPIRSAFATTPGIALVLLAATLQPRLPDVATAVWWVGAALQVALALTVLNIWLTHPTFSTSHVTPAWFIPAVGLVTAPLGGAAAAPPWVNWFFLGNGILLWVAFLPLVLGRLFLHDRPVPPRLLPTLTILVAPPVVVLLALRSMGLSRTGDIAHHALYGVAVLFLLLLLTQVPRLVRIPFSMAWWAFSFPLAAFTAATIVTIAETNPATRALAWIALAAVTVLIVGLLATTLDRMRRGSICVPEPPLP